MKRQWNSLEEYLAARRAYQEKLARIGEERKAYLAQQPKLSPEEVYQKLKERYGQKEDEEIKVKSLWKCGTPMAYQQMREEEKKKQNKKVDKKQSVEELLAKLGLVCKEEFYMDDVTKNQSAQR